MSPIDTCFPDFDTLRHHSLWVAAPTTPQGLLLKEEEHPRLAQELQGQLAAESSRTAQAVRAFARQTLDET